MFILTDGTYSESFRTLTEAIEAAHVRLELPGEHVGGIVYDGPDDSIDVAVAEFRWHDEQPGGTIAPPVPAEYHLEMLEINAAAYLVKSKGAATDG